MSEIAVAGVGSRETPVSVLTEMEVVGRWCARWGITVRSGHAKGADYAFELGAQQSAEVFLPWRSYNAELVYFTTRTRLALADSWAFDEIVRRFHPTPESLNQAVWKLHRRNGAIVLGGDYGTPQFNPSRAVVCWTKDGGVTGGTGQAIRIAAGFGIPVLNMQHPQWATAARVIAKLEELCRVT